MDQTMTSQFAFIDTTVGGTAARDVVREREIQQA